MNPFDDADKIILVNVQSTLAANIAVNMFFDSHELHGRFLGLCSTEHVRKDGAARRKTALLYVGLITDVVRQGPGQRYETYSPTSFDLSDVQSMLTKFPSIAKDSNYFYIVDSFIPVDVRNTADNDRWPPLKRSIKKITGQSDPFDSAELLVLALNEIPEYPLGAKE